MTKWIIALAALGACTDDANIGVSDQPIDCQPNAAGAAIGTLSNPYTHNSYDFGAAEVSLATDLTAVRLTDSALLLQLQFPCGTAKGTLATSIATPGSALTCPGAASVVSGNLQQVYGQGYAGTVIIDQNVGCLAGRYDIKYSSMRDNSTVDDIGEVAGWFSVPLQ